MGDGAVIGFVVTVVAMTVFLAVSYAQLGRIRRTAEGDISVGPSDHAEGDRGDEDGS